MCCHGIVGLLLPLLLFIAPQPLRFLGEKVVLCACVLCPPPPLCCFFFFPLGKAAMSPVITGCVSEVSEGLCVSLWKATHIPPACLSAWASVAERRHWLVSSLSGALPWPCLSVCLPVCFSLPACPSVSLCQLAATVLWPSWCLSCFKMTLVWGSWQISSHSSLLVSRSRACGIADSLSVLVRATAELPRWYLLK